MLVICCACAVYVAIGSTAFGTRLELSTVDARYALRGQSPQPSPSVAVVTINDETDHRLHSRFPYPRRYYAEMLRALHAAGARAVVFDVNFDFASGSVVDDEALVRAARANGPVVFATGSQTFDAHHVLPAEPLQEVSFPGVAPGEAFDYSRATYGLASATPDADDHIRRWPVRVRVRRHDGVVATRPSLVLAALRASGHPPAALDGLPDEVQLDFANRRTAIPQLNLADVLAGHALERVAGRTVFVGATSDVLHDVYPTPFDDALPGVLLQAYAFDTLSTRSWLEPVPRALRFALAALLLGVWVGCLAWLPLGRGVLAAAGTTVGYAALTQLAFTAWLVVLPAAAPIVAALSASFVLLVRVALVALGERRHISSMFERYVAPDIVRELVRRRDVTDIVSGKRREVSILFADIRGFTAMSEHADPDDIVRQLNHYLSAMTSAIHRCGGTIDKFIGDGIMAVFGAPLDLSDHADCACEAASAMLDALAMVNAQRSMLALPEFRIGIGIATGTAIVGNIGSNQRLDYTAIGDCVNLAARLEGVTARIGVPVLMSEATHLAATRVDTRPLGTHRVRGRIEPTRIATIAGLHERRPDVPSLDANADMAGAERRASGNTENHVDAA
ncbi:MAG: adenylate/guanylate cyclase with Chase sensor [Thermoleophilia bacterium]|nr:adenylate/guanylate cyclase with Chase sensor [Thermoleophilia bacterium]